MVTQVGSQPVRSQFLRRAFFGNIVFSTLGGLLLILGARPLASLLGLEAPVLLALTGVIVLAYAAWLFRAAMQEPIDYRQGLIAAALDAVWVVASVAILVTGWLPLTVAGKWAVAIVADIVAVFAVLEFLGARRLR